MADEALAAIEELFQAGRVDAVAAACRRLIVENPRSHPAFDLLGRACLASGRPAQAVELFGRAVELDGTVAGYHADLGTALLETGDPAAAIAAFRRAVALAPHAPGGHAGLARALLAGGQARAALATCDAYMASHPYHGGLVACRALVLAATGARAAAERLLGLEALVRTTLVEVPAAFATLDAFDAALAAEAAARPAAEMFVAPGPAAALLMERIDRAVRDYLADLPDDPNHPLVASAPHRWRLVGRAVDLGTAPARPARIDPWGWISGLYHAAATVPEGAADRAGWIELGRPPAGWPEAEEPIVRRVRPEAGRLILFPSYVYQRTIASADPSGDDAGRVCYVFSVVSEG